MFCNCSDLIGLPYERGADGSNGSIDCIHLVYEVLRRYEIPTPPLDPAWYEANKTTVLRALLRWGERIDCPQYDGDVLLIPQDRWVFGVTWQTGALYVNHHLSQVAWSPFSMMPTCHCFRMRSN